MAVNSWMDIVFSLASLLEAGLMVVAGVVAVLSLRNLASAVLLIGTILGLFNTIGWMVYPYIERAAEWLPGSRFFLMMRLFGTFSWMLTAIGLLLVVFMAAGLRRRNQALESIVAGSQTDRLA